MALTSWKVFEPSGKQVLFWTFSGVFGFIYPECEDMQETTSQNRDEPSCKFCMCLVFHY